MKLAIKQALIYVYQCLRSFNALRLKNKGFFSSSEGATALFLNHILVGQPSKAPTNKRTLLEIHETVSKFDK